MMRFTAPRQTHSIAIVMLSVCLSVRLFVTLVIHASTVQCVEIYCAPHDRMMFLALTPNFGVQEFRDLP